MCFCSLKSPIAILITIATKSSPPTDAVAEVWIVNLNERTIEVYREPHFTGYGSKTVLHAGDQAVPQAFPDMALNVVELLKR